MNSLRMNIKREYWEYKRMLIVPPLVLTALFFLMAIVGVSMHELAEKKRHRLDASVTQQSSQLDKNEQLRSKSNETTQTHEKNDHEPQNDQNDKEKSKSSDNRVQFWFNGFYLAVAWLAALFYFTSSLFSDRKDRSLFYWKSMPVSETHTVWSKYLFGVVAFPFAAWLISIIAATVLLGIAHLTLPTEKLVGEDGMRFTFEHIILWPALAISLAPIWCLPFFGLAMVISAYASRWPILIFISVLIGFSVLEAILLEEAVISPFFSAHSPFSLLSSFDNFDHLGQALHYIFIEQFFHIIAGLLVGGALIWLAIWLRNNRFEIGE